MYKTIRLKYSRFFGIFGVILFISSPKILPDFIYSPNDIIFLTTTLTSIYFSKIFLKKEKFKYLVLFIFFLCIAINVRIIALYILPIFLIFYSLNTKYKKRKFLFNFCLTISLTYALLLLITPQLWINPFNLLYNFFEQVDYKSFNPQIIFMGDLIYSSELPWYYLLTWIFISTPLLILFLFITGFFIILLKSITKERRKYFFLNNNFYDLILFSIPFLSFIIFSPTIFNGWRHFYFMYPLIILISISGVSIIYKKVKIHNNKKSLIILGSLPIALHLFFNVSFIFKNHPYQNIYLNYVAKNYAYNFELDYFGLSNYQALEFILENSKNKNKIVITGLNGSRPDISMNFLSNAQRNKLMYVNMNEFDNDKIDYFITHYLKGFYFEKDDNDKKYILLKNIIANEIIINSIYINK